MDVTGLLKQVREGSLSIAEAEAQLKNLPYEDLGFAKLDHHRKLRQGFEEVIYCSGKTSDQLTKIYHRLNEEQIDVLGTRASKEQYEAVRAVVPDVKYDETSKILRLFHRPRGKSGKIVVCTGGTADIPVAEEAAQTAEFFGAGVTRLYDVGVAGIHRLLLNMDHFTDATCVIAVAGMEGALAGVVAGLVDVPVIAVPTSVGYGASFGGLSALLTMLNSCANGITTVNIDNGYGAAYVATQINRLAMRGIEEERYDR